MLLRSSYLFRLRKSSKAAKIARGDFFASAPHGMHSTKGSLLAYETKRRGKGGDKVNQAGNNYGHG